MNSYKNNKNSLAQQTAFAQTLRRMARGASSVRSNPGKILGLLVLYLALLVCWFARYTVFSYRTADFAAPLNDLLLGVVLAVFAVAAPMALFWAWGGPWQSGSIQDNLRRIGFVNSAGEPPTLLSLTRDKTNPQLWLYEFWTCGLPLEVWKDAIPRIQAALNITVADIRASIDNQRFILYALPGSIQLPTTLPWTPDKLPVGTTTLALGESLLGQVLIDLNQLPHMLIAGLTGSGKTSLVRCIISQCLAKQMDVYIIDLKGGMDFPRSWKTRDCDFCDDYKAARSLLALMVQELESRKLTFQMYENWQGVNCPDIETYNQYMPNHALRHIVLVFDEIAEVVNAASKDTEDKKIANDIMRDLSTLARLGRSFGIHICASTQRPDVTGVLPAQVKANLPIRICGYMPDDTNSRLVLDNGDAHSKIPPEIKGRFINQDGTLFQGYWLDKSI